MAEASWQAGHCTLLQRADAQTRKQSCRKTGDVYAVVKARLRQRIVPVVKCGVCDRGRGSRAVMHGTALSLSQHLWWGSCCISERAGMGVAMGRLG